MEEIRVALPQVELFECLVNFGEQTRSRGHTVRLVGGAAMWIWGRVMHQPMAMTQDLDFAVVEEDIPDIASAARTCMLLDRAAKAIGRRRPDGWRASRVGRFQYSSDQEQEAKIEFLCGELGVGRASRRTPAWLISALDPEALVDGEPTSFYAARTPWLSKVRSWVQAHLACGPRESTMRVPDLGGMAVLKLRAVGDKLNRLEEVHEPDERAYERGRLERHTQHMVQSIQWLEQSGQLHELRPLVLAHDDIGDLSREIAGRMDLFGQLGAFQRRELLQTLDRLQ